MTGEVGKNSPNIKSQVMMEIPEGSIINGVITNAEELSQYLEEFWDQNSLSHKNVHVVIQSSKFVSKQIQLPKVKRNKMEAMVPMEFSDVERHADAIFDYMDIPGQSTKSMQEVLGLMAEREFVETYINLFNRLGIEITGFSHASGAAIKALASLSQLKDNTCIIQIADGYNLESILWVEGKFIQSTSRRIFAEPETEEFNTEILRHTSSMLQFYQSMKRDTPLSMLYVCGVTPEQIANMQLLEESFETGVSIQALPLAAGRSAEAGEKVGDYIYAYGTLIQGVKDINLFQVYKKINKKKHDSGKGTELRKHILPLAIIFVIGLLITGVFGGIYLYKSMTLAKLNDYITEPVNVAIVGEVDQLDAKIRGNYAIVEDVTKVNGMRENYPRVNMKIVYAIASCADGSVAGTIESYDASTGELGLSAKAVDESVIYQYISRLYDTGLFEDVQYSGYTYQQQDNLYSVDVSCFLKTEAGR